MELAQLDLNKLYSYADYYAWKFEERVELIKGKIFRMSPAPLMWHQMVVGRLHVKIGMFLENKPCNVFEAPFDVRLPKKSKADKDIFTVLQPDLCVVCDNAKLDRRGCIGAPDLVVEVLSPGNNSKELRKKFEAYEEAGVKEYWIVSPQNETFLVYNLVDGKFVPEITKATGDIITSKTFPGFSLELTALFHPIIPNED